MIGKIYFARVPSSDEPFDPITHAREDEQVMGIRYSHVVEESAIIEVEMIAAAGGIMTGHPWGIVSFEVDGIVTEIARGQIVNFPLSLLGEMVKYELICRSGNHVAAVDALYAAQDHLVPKELETLGKTRRTAPYLLSYIYHDPRTLTPSLDPICGSGGIAAVLFGEGADPDQSNIFGLKMELSDNPASSVSITLESIWEQIEYGKVDIAAQFDLIDDYKKRTLTPLALADSLRSIKMTGGYELLTTSVSTSAMLPIDVYTSERSVDPATCIVTPAQKSQVMRHSIDDIAIETICTASQPRKERITVTVVPGLKPVGGESDVAETLGLYDPEHHAYVSRYISYRRNPAEPGLTTTTRYGVLGSIFMASGGLRASTQDIINATARRAARIAAIRAHCVRLTIDTTAEAAAEITLKDRIQVYDARLPGGTATGKVIGVGIDLTGSSASGQIILACPVSDTTYKPGNTIATEGIERMIKPTGGAIEDGWSIAQTAHINAVRDGDAMHLTESMDIIDGADVQEPLINYTDEDNVISDPQNVIPPTTIDIQMTDLDPTDIELMPVTMLKYKAFDLRLPEGISL